MYKDLEKFKFHCFTDNKDEWVKTEKEANKIIKDWKKNENTNFRIYTCTWNKIEGIYEDENCIYSVGAFPM